MDLFSRRIVGWRVDDNMEDALVIVPLRAAIQIRQLAKGLIVHSDRAGRPVPCTIRLYRISESIEGPARGPEYERAAGAVEKATNIFTLS